MTEAFASAENMVITGGNFTMVNGQRREEQEERGAMKQLYSHASPDGFHISQMRSREVDNQQSVRELVRRWKPNVQNPSHFAESFAVEDVLRNIFTWLRDPPIARFPSMWVNGNNRCQTALIAQAVAHILDQCGEVSASFFFSQATGASSVIPSIAYQLADKIPPVRSQIQAIIHDPTIFDSSFQVQVQLKKLIIDPLWKASESHGFSHPTLILIHGLEDCDNHDFQESFLDEFSQGLESLKHKLSLKLLVLGQHTTLLNDCFAKLAGRSMVLRHPIDSGHWLRVEEENYWKEIELRKWEERTYEEGSTERFQMREHKIAQRERQMEQELEQRKKQVEKMEEEVKKRERDLDRREHQLKDMSVGDDDTRSGGSGMLYGGPSRLPSDYHPKPNSIGRGRVFTGTSPPTSYQGNGNSRPSTAPPVTSTLSMHSDKLPYAGNRMSSSRSIPSTPVTGRSATMDRLPSDTQSPTTQRCGQPQLEAAPHRRYTITSDSQLTDTNSIPVHSTKPSPGPWPLSSSTSGSSSKYSTGDGDSSYSLSPVIIDHDPRIVPLKMTDSRGNPTPPPPSSASQAAIDSPECIWQTDDNNVVVAGTLEGLVQFLVITIDSEKYKGYRDIFSMACAEVTIPDQLFQIIARRLNDAKNEASADVRVGQHNAFLVIEHWLKLGYVPSNQNLRETMKYLCVHAIQSKSEAARLYGITNLRKLVDEIMGHSAPPSLMGQGGIPTSSLEPHDLAIVLSLLEGENYQALRPLDYVLHLTKKRSKNINKFYETNDKIRLWVIESILQYDDVLGRTQVMTYFIKTAIECREMRNLSSAIAIISALYSTAIQRLKATRKSLTRDKEGKLTTLYHIVNPDSEYRGYWDTLKSAPTVEKMGICIPWLRVHLYELQKALHEINNEHPITIQEEGQHLINLERYMAFMACSTKLLHYTPPSVGDHHQGEQFKYLLAQLRTIAYSQGTDERQLERSADLQGREVSNRRSRKDQMSQLGFQ